MKNSPCPVPEIAQVALSANVPAPISGLSPTRPGSFAVIPPVEVAAATVPSRSHATAPTVPCFAASSRVSACPAVRRASSASSAARRRSVMKYSASSIAMPWARKNRIAPSPINSTCSDRSITIRAASTGLRGPRMPPTAPARRPAPSITAASISGFASVVSTAPCPALNSGSSSSAITAWVTASSAAPPAARIACPASSALRNPACVAEIISAVIASGRRVPAPP